MKVLPTKYGGIYFRSRTEARWAIFFDLLGLRYEYEPEGVMFENGVQYLPDFYLPGVRGGIFVEIKGALDSVDDEVFESLISLAIATDGYSSLIVGGPGDRTTEFALTDVTIIFPMQGCIDTTYAFCRCPHCGRIGLEFNGRGERVCGYDDGPRWHTGADGVVREAAERARAAFRGHESKRSLPRVKSIGGICEMPSCDGGASLVAGVTPP